MLYFLCSCSYLFTFLLFSQFYWHIRLKSTAYFFDPPGKYIYVHTYGQWIGGTRSPPNKILGASLRSSTESIILSLTGRCLVSREQCWVMCRHASQWDGLANTRSAAHLLDPSSDIQRYWRSIHATDVLTGREHGPSTPLVCTDHLGSHLGRRSRQTVVRWNQCFFWEPLGLQELPALMIPRCNTDFYPEKLFSAN